MEYLEPRFFDLTTFIRGQGFRKKNDLGNLPSHGATIIAVIAQGSEKGTGTISFEADLQNSKSTNENVPRIKMYQSREAARIDTLMGRSY